MTLYHKASSGERLSVRLEPSLNRVDDCKWDAIMRTAYNQQLVEDGTIVFNDQRKIIVEANEQADGLAPAPAPAQEKPKKKRGRPKKKS